MKCTMIRGVRIIREPDDAAREAFAAAVRHRPQRYLCLRQSTRAIASDEPGAT